MNWTLADIRSKVRRLTGKPSTNQISDARIDEYINDYYRNDLPLELGSLVLEGNTTFQTVSGTGTYEQTIATYLSPRKPIKIKETGGSYYYVDIDLYFDEEEFYKKYLYDDDDTGQPNAVLWTGTSFVVRPIPDDAYTVLYFYELRPAELSAGTDNPLLVQWGKLIAYNAAIEILTDDGDLTNIGNLERMARKHRATLSGKDMSDLTETRAIPRF